MQRNSARLGEASILLSALLWSLFPVLTILTYSTLSPLFTAGIATLLASLFFAVLLTIRDEWGMLLARGAWKDIALATFFIGIAYYGLMFLALRSTSAGNAAILALMEVFFSFLIVGLLLKHEPLSPRTIIGGTCMVLGAVLVLLPNATMEWQKGSLLVIAATAFAPLGNRHAQRARALVTSNAIMFVRSLLSGSTLLALGLIIEPYPTTQALIHSAGYLLINGILVLGLSKILWIEGIHRLPITKAISIESINPLFTLLFAFLILHEMPGLPQIAALVPIGVGMLLLTKSASDPEEATSTDLP
jgi:drug/metabolite transporter (DMT)-like permease